MYQMSYLAYHSNRYFVWINVTTPFLTEYVASSIQYDKESKV